MNTTPLTPIAALPNHGINLVIFFCVHIFAIHALITYHPNTHNSTAPHPPANVFDCKPEYDTINCSRYDIRIRVFISVKWNFVAYLGIRERATLVSELYLRNRVQLSVR